MLRLEADLQTKLVRGQADDDIVTILLDNIRKRFCFFNLSKALTKLVLLFY